MKLYQRSAVELRKMLERGETTSEEIVRQLQARADETEPSVRGFTRQRRELVLEEAKERDRERGKGELRGPLHGLPFTVKENIAVRGLPTTVGLAGDRDTIAARDAVIVAAAKRAGALCLGKSNVPQALLSMACDNSLYGATFNPWSRSHVTGGSSSGEGALVASGASLLGFGTDLGGSIRFPAAFCGISGFKPTQDAWSNRGVDAAIRGQEFVRSQVGPLARRAGDLELLWEALPTREQAAFDGRVAPVPQGPGEGASPDRKIRVGYWEEDGVVEALPSMRRAVRLALDALEAEGVEVVRCEPWHHRELVHLYLAAVSSDGLRTLERRFEGEAPHPSARLMWQLGRAPAVLRAAASRVLRVAGEGRLADVLTSTGERRVAGLWHLTARREVLRVLYEEAWRAADIDALVLPAAATPAVPLGMEHDASLIFSYFCVFNLLGMPAGVVPVTRVAEDEVRWRARGDRFAKRLSEIAARSRGLPVAVQVAAPRWTDSTVLRLMRLIEDRARAHLDYPITPVDP